MTPVERLLHGVGYLVAHLLFVRAETPEAIVRRLRLAYRLVGVRIDATPTVDGVHRTVFRCPYRDVGADRWGAKWLCHEKLDRVDDGYVTFLARKRDVTYLRPRACAEAEGCMEPNCYSEVSMAGRGADDLP